VSSPRPLLLVGADAGRGADALFVLRLVRWLRAQGRPVEVLLWRGGPLLAQLRAQCSVELVDDLNRWWLARILQVVGLRSVAARLKGLRLRWSLWRRTRGRTTVVLGAEAGRIVGYLVGSPPFATVLWGGVEELDAISVEDRAVLLARSATVIAADQVGADELEAAGAPRGSTVVVAPFLPVPASRAGGDAVRRRLGLPDDAVVVAGAGTDDWWKAPDPFVVVAWEVQRRRPDLDLHFLWVCADDDPDGLWPLRHDVRAAGLEGRVHVATTVPLADPLSVADVVLVATRDASFRLVEHDVALAARPVVCADDGVVGDKLGDAALRVPYLDVDAMATAVLRVLEDDALAASLADAAHQRMGWTLDHADVAPGRLLAAVDGAVGRTG
jgi:glycosyltransferase involved in cell wall biosynthesis